MTLQCILISGNSGSGKTELSQYLQQHIKDAYILECDRYHKWERGDDHWKDLTHLDTNANYINRMYEDVTSLQSGHDIYQVDYDHTSGKFTEQQSIKSTKTLIVCGLHSLYNKIHGIKIYMDTMKELNTLWKIKRDTTQRRATRDSVLQQIKNRDQDMKTYILPQRDNADIIVNFYTDDIIDMDNIKNNYHIKLRVFIKNGPFQNILQYDTGNYYDILFDIITSCLRK
jgi:uridine kinase